VKVTLTRVPAEDKVVLANLLQLYLHDLSQFIPLELTAHGTFVYPYLDLYFREPEREAYFAAADGRLAGFTLAHREKSWTVAEFFITRRHRRQGIGKEVAKNLFTLHPGTWTLTTAHGNKPAETFWRTLITTPTTETHLYPPQAADPCTQLQFTAPP
jgi:predicted acetyltransferase